MAFTAPVDIRTWPATVGTERAMLAGLLGDHGQTLVWRCAGLTEEQLRAPRATTTLPLLGLVRHMTDDDRGWFYEFVGEPPEPIYSTADAPNDDFDATGSVPVAEVSPAGKPRPTGSVAAGRHPTRRRDPRPGGKTFFG